MLGELKLPSNDEPSIEAFEEAISKALYVALDFEFTGLKDSDKIIEAGLVFLDENFTILATYEVIINPQRDTGQVHIHHITNEMVVGKPTFKEVADELAHMINGKVIAGLNTALDLRGLDKELVASGYSLRPGISIDLIPIVSDPNFNDNLKYEKVLKEIVDSQATAHRALPDAMEVTLLLPYVIEFAQGRPDRVSKQYSPCVIESMSYSGARDIGREPLSSTRI